MLPKSRLLPKTLKSTLPIRGDPLVLEAFYGDFPLFFRGFLKKIAILGVVIPGGSGERI